MAPSEAGDAGPLLEVRGLRKEYPLRRGGRRSGRASGPDPRLQLPPGEGPAPSTVEVGVERRRGSRPMRGPDDRGRRGTLPAVDGASFELRTGETLGLVGESGCGKTTLVRSVLRLVEPTGGEIRYRGRDVRDMGEKDLRALRRRIQIVFQDPFSALNPRLRIGDALEEVLHVHDLGGGREGRRHRVGELLELVGLRPEHARRYPHQFSGGQRQRIGIARALAVEPEAILLDEPVSALDVSVRAQVVGLLRRLQEELGLAYLFVAHDLAVVEQVSHRVAVMYLGRIVESGPAERIYRNPMHPYTRALLSAAPVPDPRGREVRQRIVLTGDPGGAVGHGGCPFHPRCWWPARDGACLASAPSPAAWKGPGGHQAACIKLESPPVGST